MCQMLFLTFIFVCFPRAGSFQLWGASVDSGHLLGDVCQNLRRGAAASGGFYTYLALGSLQTSCREEETFPLPQDNLLSYRKRVYVSGWSIWTWKRLHPEGRLHRWPKSTPWFPSLGGTWGRTCSRMCSRCWRSITWGILFLPCSRY